MGYGGGPSREDLEDIDKLTEEMKGKGVEIIQSTPEEYIDVCKKNLSLPKVDFSLNPWAPGCYTSQVRIKQKYRNAENIYFLTESICTRAFFALASGQKKAPADKIPFFAYNPYPYPVTGNFWVEFMLWDQDWDRVYLAPTVFDENGNIIPSQCEKERSTLPLQWRKRVVFHATLEPMSMNRFECGFEIKNEKPSHELENNDTHYIFDCKNSHIEINKKTGLVDAFEKNGVNYLDEHSFTFVIKRLCAL